MAGAAQVLRHPAGEIRVPGEMVGSFEESYEKWRGFLQLCNKTGWAGYGSKARQVRSRRKAHVPIRPTITGECRAQAEILPLFFSRPQTSKFKA